MITDDRWVWAIPPLALILGAYAGAAPITTLGKDQPAKNPWPDVPASSIQGPATPLTYRSTPSEMSVGTTATACQGLRRCSCLPRENALGHALHLNNHQHGGNGPGS